MKNREIKYRFWYAHDNKMYGVASVSMRFSDEDFNRVFIMRELSHGEPLNYRADGVSGILMQFTGLHDKNGKEIYDKDIVKSKWGVFVIEWYSDNIEAGWKQRILSNHDDIGKICNLIGLEDENKIIGNVFETPDLLKAE